MIGTLSSRLIAQRATESVNTFGEPIKSWSTLTTVWGSLEWKHGTETFSGDRDFAQVPVEVVVHRGSNTQGLREKDRWLVPAGATTLASAISGSTDTSITVTAATEFPPENEYCVRIENELVLVTDGNGTAGWTVSRGIYGTTAASHSNGEAVTHMVPLDIVSAWTDRDKVHSLAVRSEVRMTT